MAARLPAHRGREIAAEPVADRRGEQEVEQVLGQGVEHVLGEVVADGVMPPGEAADERAGIVAVAQRQRRELERGDPPVGGRPQLVDRLVVQGERVDAEEELRGLLPVEPQEGGVDLSDLVAYLEPPDRGCPGAAGDHQVQVVRTRVEQEVEGGGGIRVVDEVPVVEDDRERASVLRDLVDQLGEHVAPDVLRALLQQVNQLTGGQVVRVVGDHSLHSGADAEAAAQGGAPPSREISAASAGVFSLPFPDPVDPDHGVPAGHRRPSVGSSTTTSASNPATSSCPR
ncbi:hypothetical protein [Pseudonocardia thermophila]|uniref:hypothetical protein n=1 Tax=Pseudonocardia thermophila TaxID=1848 RepID=UPI00190E7BA8|nr:hypothetical protein [Pseudonocardia thermophila]